MNQSETENIFALKTVPLVKLHVLCLLQIEINQNNKLE